MFNNFKRKATRQLNNRQNKNQKQSDYQIQTRSSTVLSDTTINSLSTISEESIEMTQPQDIFNNLRIPDVIKDLQTFDGNPRALPDFIKSVEEILLFIRNTDNTPYGQVLLRAIRNKIVGPANEALNNHLTQLNWDDIKKVITDLYADKREESTLIRELHNLKQYNRSIIEFYNSVLEIQSLLITNVRSKETNQNVRSSKKNLYEDICLNVFLTGLKEPMGATIRAMRPSDLSSALTLCQKEETIANANPFNYNKPNYYTNPNYTNKPSDSVVPFNKRPHQNSQYHQHPKRSYNNYEHSTNNYNQEERNFNNNNNNYPQRNFNNNNNNNYPQRNFNNNYNNNNHNNNNNNYPQIKSSNSNMTRQNSNMSRNQSSQNRWNRQNGFKIEELNNIDNQQQYPKESEEDSNIDDTQNFRDFASNHRSDT